VTGNVDNDAACVHCSGRVLREWGFTWELRWAFELQTAAAAAVPAARKRKASPATPTSSLNVNVGISVDYSTASGTFDSPLQCIAEARHQILGSSEHQQARKISRVTAAPVQPFSAAATQHCAVDCSYDSFDNCLEAAEHMDALLAYYYADEKESGAMKVVEIFPLHRHHEPPSVSTRAIVSSSSDSPSPSTDGSASALRPS